MIHGVCPPLTAKVKRPRAAIAARESAAIVAAAARATESASSKTSSVMKLSPNGIRVTTLYRMRRPIATVLFVVVIGGEVSIGWHRCSAAGIGAIRELFG